MRKFIIVFGTWGLVWLLTGNVIYGIASMFFLPYILVRFFGFEYATDNCPSDEDNSIVNQENKIYNPSTGLPMISNSSGGFDIGGNGWCE